MIYLECFRPYLNLKNQSNKVSISVQTDFMVLFSKLFSNTLTKLHQLLTFTYLDFESLRKLSDLYYLQCF